MIMQAPSTNSAAPMELEITREPMNATSLIMIAWMMGALLVLATIMLGIARVHWIARRARPLVKGGCASAVHTLAREHGVSVDVLEGDDFAMPMTWGIIRPKLLLPRSAHRWPDARLNAVLRHELAHVRRRDPLWQLLGEIACALHWYNPLAWYAARCMRVQREHACDDAVLTAGSRGSEYAAELLDIARSLRAARATSVAAIAMARPRQLEGRLLAVLDESRSRGDVRSRWPVWAIGALLVIPLAALQPVREVAADIPTESSLRSRIDGEFTPQPKREGRTPKAEPRKPIAIAHSPAPTQASLGAVFAIAQQGSCLRESVRNLSISSHSDDSEYQRVKWETRNCTGTMEMFGKVRIAGDLSGFESISPGGKVVISTREDGRKRELTLTPSGNRFAYDYEVDGDRRAWDSEAQTWLASVVQMLVRRAGFGADERVDYLLKNGGLNAVLQEVDVIESDYVQRQYLTKTLNKTTLNGGAVESVLQLAARELDSDYELTEFLILVGRKYDFTAGSRAAFIAATNTLQSDYEHRRALAAVLKKGGLSSDDVTAMLTSAKDINSDYEKAELLIGIAARYQLDPKMRTAYLAATRDMRSDYEKKRVFTTLLKEGGLSGADLAYILDATSTVTSSYERSEILKMVSTNLDFTQPQLQEAYLRAAAEIRSDYELRQVLSSVLKRERLTAGGLNVVLTAAEKINSDYEQSELLMQVLRGYTLNAEQRNRVIKMADQMSSEYERGKVSSLLIKQLNTQ
jgi:beta-lactamase regulating signal transducer with metallopeptidase domain